MAINDQYFNPGQILQPFQPSPLNRRNPAKFAASLNIVKGQAMGLQTSTDTVLPLNRAASDGTQTFYGFSEYSLGTDAAGLVYLTFGGSSAGPSYLAIGSGYSSLWTGGIFNPNELTTAAVGTPVAEVDTFTASSPTTGDIYQVILPDGAVVQATVGSTQTATGITTLLKAAWAANPAAVAVATATGTATLILTAVAPGVLLGLTAAVAPGGTGTFAKVITTPAVAAQQAEIDTFTPAGSITTGDVYTLTITYASSATHAVSFTVAGTTTAAAVSAGLIAAWNGDGQAAQLATATGTNTVVLTGAIVGNTMSIAGTVAGSGTISKVVTKVAYGQSLADIQASRPGAYLIPNGCWSIP